MSNKRKGRIPVIHLEKYQYPKSVMSSVDMTVLLKRTVCSANYVRLDSQISKRSFIWINVLIASAEMT